MTVTIYHNPKCGTSRNTLELIRAAGIEPTIIEYLKTPPTRDKLKELSAAMGVTPRGLLRTRGQLFLPPSVGHRAEQRDERRRRGQNDAACEPFLDESRVLVQGGAKELLTGEKEDDEFGRPVELRPIGFQRQFVHPAPDLLRMTA